MGPLDVLNDAQALSGQLGHGAGPWCWPAAHLPMAHLSQQASCSLILHTTQSHGGSGRQARAKHGISVGQS